MREEERAVKVEFLYDEAYEILSRCLYSSQADTPLFRDALRKLAWAIECEDAAREAAADADAA